MYSWRSPGENSANAAAVQVMRAWYTRKQLSSGNGVQSRARFWWNPPRSRSMVSGYDFRMTCSTSTVSIRCRRSAISSRDGQRGRRGRVARRLVGPQARARSPRPEAPEAAQSPTRLGIQAATDAVERFARQFPSASSGIHEPGVAHQPSMAGKPCSPGCGSYHAHRDVTSLPSHAGGANATLASTVANSTSATHSPAKAPA